MFDFELLVINFKYFRCYITNVSEASNASVQISFSSDLKGKKRLEQNIVFLCHCSDIYHFRVCGLIRIQPSGCCRV